jgi:RNA polymerase sigma-70 factor, ECF subfamily
MIVSIICHLLAYPFPLLGDQREMAFGQYLFILVRRLDYRNTTLAIETSRATGPAAGFESWQLLDDAEARQLLRAAQQYDDRALARIYQMYADRVFRYIFYRIGERNRAEDLTGEVFVRLIENIGGFRLGARGHALALTGWIFRIAHNLIVDEYRRRRVRNEVDTVPQDDDVTIDPAMSLDLHLNRADLQSALLRLTGDQQSVILLRFDQGMSNAEIGKILGKTETAVKALQRRALAALQRHLLPSSYEQA